MEDYSKSKASRFGQYLRLPGGIPSHDTSNRFFSAPDPLAFEEAFRSWIRVSVLTEGEAVSMDGKTVSGSRDKGWKHAIHTVSARLNANQSSRGQVKVDEKSNAITAIPGLLGCISITGLYCNSRCGGLSAGNCRKNWIKRSGSFLSGEKQSGQSGGRC